MAPSLAKYRANCAHLSTPRRIAGCQPRLDNTPAMAPQIIKTGAPIISQTISNEAPIANERLIIDERVNSANKNSEQKPNVPAIWPIITRAKKEFKGSIRTTGLARIDTIEKIIAPLNQPAAARKPTTPGIIQGLSASGGIARATLDNLSIHANNTLVTPPQSAPTTAVSRAPTKELNTTRLKSAAFHRRSVFTRFLRQ